MNIKNTLKNMVGSNMYINDFAFRLTHPINDIKFERELKKLSCVDSLKDITELQRFCLAAKKEGQPFFSSRINDVNFRMYGIGESIFKDLDRKWSIKYPAVEHGLILHNKVWSDILDTKRPTAITFGEYRKNILLRDWRNPVFCVGPYIQYAEDYYTTEEIKLIKNRIGKTLLVIPTHTTDASKPISNNDEILIQYILSQKNNYDTIIVCMFWWDLDTQMVKVLKKNGCKIVSAGHREDKRFLSRLKTIILLADKVEGNGMGTHIGYCVKLNKPFQIVALNGSGYIYDEKEKNIDAALEQSKIIIDAFSEESNRLTEKQKKCYDYYWGGKYSRTPQEIEAIFQINKEIISLSKGNINKYKSAISRIKIKYESGNSDLDSLKIQLLNEALVR